MIIYKTTNKINGKIYVGQAQKNDDEYLGSGILIERAIKKYGKENFKKEILETCNNKKKLNKREIFWIKKLNSKNKGVGYNISGGGQGGQLCDIKKLKGKNHYLNKMTNEEREEHLNKFRRGINYWKSKGFTTIEEIEKWIKDNWCGKNHSHKKGKTKKEYEKWLKSTNIGCNFRTEKWRKSMRGRNNPIFRGKTKMEIEEWLNKHRRGENSALAKYHYEIIKPDGEILHTNCLKEICNKFGFNLHVLRRLIEIELGEKKSYNPRLKQYVGWKVIRTERKR